MIYDITQPLPDCAVYPGDPAPEMKKLCSTENGDLYNLTWFSMCAHNGTHVDAPLHFLPEGRSVDGVDLERMIGPAFVTGCSGDLSAADAEELLQRAAQALPGAEKRILIRGNAVVTEEAARVFAAAGVFLVGNESQTVGPEEAPMQVHRILLGAETVLLEGIRLAEVPDGVYTLYCAPLKLTGADGSPCRAVLIG